MRISVKWIVFSVLWQFLYFAQLFIVKPGTDVSPYAYKYGLIHYIKFGGLTSSALASILLILFCFITLFIQEKIILNKNTVKVSSFVMMIFIISFLSGNQVVSSFDYIVKLIMPMIIYIFFQACFKKTNPDSIINLVRNINILVIGQVLICKAVTGEFAANTYYHEMPEEYFGYFNNPHPFTALLGLLALWNAVLVYEKKNRILNSLLFTGNVLLVYLSHVRTYMLAFLIAFVYLILRIKARKGSVSKYIYIVFAAATIFGIVYVMLYGDYASARTVTDVSSGRFYRWYLDIQYFLHKTSVYHKLVGNGPEAIYRINQELFSTNINSLNCFIDLLADIGIIGLAALAGAYYMILRDCISGSNMVFMIPICVYLAIGALINNILPYVIIMPLFMILLFVMRSYDIKKGELQKYENISALSAPILSDNGK